MSRTIRQTALSGLLGSKRFIVAVCAAIAMVLGAMSVGASIVIPPTIAENGQLAANGPVFTERGHGVVSDRADSSRESGGFFMQQPILTPSIIATQPSIPSTALLSNKTGLGIKFGPVNTGAGLSLGGLQVKAETSIPPTTDSSALPAAPTSETVIVEPPKLPEEDPVNEEPPTTADPVPPSTEDSVPMSFDATSSLPPNDSQP